MVKKVSGVNPKKVDSDVMTEELTRLGLDSSGSIPVKIERLSAYIRKGFCGDDNQAAFDEWLETNYANPDVVVCDPGCCGVSNAMMFARCPFCGEEEEMSEETEVEVLTATTLDENVNKIVKLKNSMVENYYSLGLALKENKDKELWRLRVTKDGGTKYSSFEQWSRAEVDLGRTQAMKCIHVVENFTEEEVRKIGHSKLAIALQVPEANRAALLEEASRGASKRDLEKLASQIKEDSEESDDPEDDQDSDEDESVPQDVLEDDGERLQDAVTVALVLASSVVSLTQEGEALVGEETLPNGVVQAFRVQTNDEGESVLVINRFRP